MAGCAPRLPGWYGKLPALGDFASRRLPPAFISFWDAWLQRGMASSRIHLQERWLERYLNGPLWNFALLPGVCGESAWAGAMMPSVDKVGRHFPLTIAVELEPLPEIMETLLAAQDWFAGIEQLALACLDVGFDPAQLEQRLHASAFPVPRECREQEGARRMDRWWNGQPGSALALELPSRESLGTLFRDAGLNQAGRAGYGRSIWWSVAAPGGAVRLQAYPGMPHELDFAALLDAAN